MTFKQTFALSVAVFFLLVMLGMSMFGEKGFLDYVELKKEKDRVVAQNRS